MLQASDAYVGYKWDNKYILPYEIPAAIRERFRLFNYVSGSKKIHLIEKNLIDWSANLYYENSFFDDTGKYDGFRFYPISKNLRYCPKCARLGYISYYHLNLMYDKCFVHGYKLYELKDVPSSMSLDKDYPYEYDQNKYSEAIKLSSVAEIVEGIPRLKKKIEASSIPYLDQFKRIKLFSFDQSTEATKIFRKIIDPSFLIFKISRNDITARYESIIRNATKVVAAQKSADSNYLDDYWLSKWMEEIELNIRTDIGEGFQFQLLHDFLFPNQIERSIPYLPNKFCTFNDLSKYFTENEIDFALKAAFCYLISDRDNSTTIFSHKALFHPSTSEKKSHPGMLKSYATQYLYSTDEALNAVLTYEIFKFYITETWTHYKQTLLNNQSKCFNLQFLYIAITETKDNNIQLYICS